MEKYSEIKSQFVRDRMKETSWKDHRYIGWLMALERIIARGGPKGFSDGMYYGKLRIEYPIEAEAIRLELCEGKAMSCGEFRARKEARRKELERHAEAWQRYLEAQRRDEELERQEWLKLGGLP
jgi:hypothetical protein